MSRPHLAQQAPTLLAGDVHDELLRAHTHPSGWSNPTPAGRYNLVVIGAGTAGLVAAAGAAGLGGRVALVERALLGGDCLNYGCVPSKALLASARVAQAVRSASGYGVHAGSPRVDFGEVMARVRALRAGIAPHDSAARFRALGVDVFLGSARFVAKDAVEVDGARLEFARALIATGGRAVAPPIPGLEEVPYLTHETVFTLTRLPPRLVVLGAGPVGCELAQAFRRLGSQVTLVSEGGLLPREDREAAAVLQRRFEVEGVELRLNARVLRAGILFPHPDPLPAGEGTGVRVQLEVNGQRLAVDGDVLLVAVGRAPSLEGLGLEAAGVRATAHGVEVDDFLRTGNRRIYAAGDIASRFKFTHAADALSRVALQNALFLGRKKVSALVIPWSTYTDPEVAHVGLSAEEAAKRPRTVTLTVPFSAVDRAILEGETEGFARVHVDEKSGRILGGTLVGAHAGESVGELVLAMTQGLSVGALAATVLPYPTRGEVLKKLGDAWSRRRLTPRTKGLLTRFLSLRR